VSRAAGLVILLGLLGLGALCIATNAPRILLVLFALVLFGTWIGSLLVREDREPVEPPSWASGGPELPDVEEM
jgi:hypothetical protein